MPGKRKKPSGTSLNQYLFHEAIAAAKSITLQRKKEVIKACGISPATLKNWLIGRTPVPKLAQDKISEIAGKRITFKRVKNGSTNVHS
jgi:hypothetical protein